MKRNWRNCCPGWKVIHEVLYVHGSSKIEGIINALRKLGIDHEIYPTRMVDVFVNDSEAIEVAAHCRQSGITHIMSIH